MAVYTISSANTWYQVLFWYLPGPGSKRAEAILKRDVSRLPSTDWPTSVVTGSDTDQTVNKHKTRDKHTQVVFLQLAFSRLGPSFPKALHNDRR